jgi:predicted transcriptional regulator
MKGTEGQILKIVREMQEADDEAIARKMGITQAYAARICKNLIKDGYLREKAPGKYILTPKSEKEISRVVCRGPIAVLKGGL